MMKADDDDGEGVEQRQSTTTRRAAARTTTPVVKRARTAARRLQLAWQTARTQAKAQQTLQHYEGLQTELSRDSWHKSTHSLSEHSDSSTTSFSNSALYPNSLDDNNSSNHSHGHNRARCRTIDHAMAGLYSLPVESSSLCGPQQVLEEPMVPVLPLHSSFQLSQGWDALEHAAAASLTPQDVAWTDYWQGQLYPGPALPQQKANETGSMQQQQQQQQQMVQEWEQEVYQLLHTATQRPLMHLFERDEEDNHKDQPCTGQEISQSPQVIHHMDTQEEEEEKKNDKEDRLHEPQPPSYTHTQPNNKATNSNPQQNNNDIEDDDDDDFGDFQSTTAFSSMSGAAVTTASTSTNSSTNTPTLVDNPDTCSGSSLPVSDTNDTDINPEPDVDEMFHTPEQPPPTPLAAAVEGSLHPGEKEQNEMAKEEEDPSKTSDGTASLIARVDHILGTSETVDSPFTSPHEATATTTTSQYLSTPQLVHMAQTYLGPEATTTKKKQALPTNNEALQSALDNNPTGAALSPLSLPQPYLEPFSPVSPQSTTATTPIVAMTKKSSREVPSLSPPLQPTMFQSSSPLPSSPSSAFDSPAHLSSSSSSDRKARQITPLQRQQEAKQDLMATHDHVLMPTQEEEDESTSADADSKDRHSAERTSRDVKLFPQEIPDWGGNTTSLKPSLSLPLEDLTSLEGRWTRRRQLEYQHNPQGTAHSVVEPPRTVHTEQNGTEPLQDLAFLAPRDETVQLLNSLPWEYVAGFAENDDHDGAMEDTHAFLASSSLQHGGESELWDQVMTDRLCKYDSRLELVQHEMARRVDPAKMEQVNELIHIWDTNLRVAQVYYERAVESLCSAVHRTDLQSEHATEIPQEEEGIGLYGQSVLLELWQAKEDYKCLDDLLSELQSMFDIEQEIIRRIDNFDAQQSSALEEYRDVRALADQVIQIASGPLLASMSCLSETRDRLATLGDRFWNRLQQQLTNLVTRVCRRRSRPTSAVVSRSNSFSSGRLNHSNNSKMKALLMRSNSTTSSVSGSSLSETVATPVERTEYNRIVQMQMDRNTDWTEYQRIIRAGLDLKNVAVVGDAASASAWSQTIVESLSFEAMRCFAVALLDPPDRRPSRFDPDLVQLSTELKDWGDASKLRQTCHNLVTIRFQFEASEFYFPRVFQHLCDGLINILRMATDFVEFHRHASSNAGEGDGDVARLAALTVALSESLEPLWAQCEDVLVQCLDEYLNFAGKRDFFSFPSTNLENGETTNTTIDDSVWIEDLAGLENVLLATENFLSYRSWLLDTAKTTSLTSMLESGGSESNLFDRLSQLCQAHLRSVHVEMMNCMGKQISQDSWDFVPIKDASGVDLKGSNACDILQKALESRLNKYEDVMEELKASAVGSLVGTSLTAHREEWSGLLASDSFCDETAVSQFMNSFRPCSNDESFRVAPVSIGEGFIGWIARLTLIADKLPLVADAIGDVVTNTFDLYVTTVLRLCAGNAKNERVLIGCDRPLPIRAIVEDGRRSPLPIGKRPASPAVFFGKERRRSKPPKAQIARPVLREVDICAPLLRDEVAYLAMRKFLVRAQESLEGIVNLDRVDSWILDPEGSYDPRSSTRILERKTSAAWSCFVLASLGRLCCSLSSSRLVKRHGSIVRDKLQSLEEYIHSLEVVVLTLAESTTLFSCVKAINGQGIVSNIISVGAGWEECKLHEHSNDYVEELVERCSTVCGLLMESETVAPQIAIDCLDHVVQAGYLCMLEGFSRVAFCSTEGRALMALDLASFSAAGVGKASTKHCEKIQFTDTIKRVSHSDGIKRVDTYIKVFYYPRDEVLKWVKENFLEYSMSHSMALVANFFDSSGTEETLDNLLQEIKKIYES